MVVDVLRVVGDLCLVAGFLFIGIRADAAVGRNTQLRLFYACLTLFPIVLLAGMSVIFPICYSSLSIRLYRYSARCFGLPGVCSGVEMVNDVAAGFCALGFLPGCSRPIFLAR